MKKLDLVVTNLGGGDISLDFVEPSLFDELEWMEEETTPEHTTRVSFIMGNAYENKDDRIVKTIFAQQYTDGESVNIECQIGRVMLLQA